MSDKYFHVNCELQISSEDFGILKEKYIKASLGAGYDDALIWRSIGSTNDEAKKMFTRSKNASCIDGFLSHSLFAKVRQPEEYSQEGCSQECSGESSGGRRVQSAVFWALEQTAGRGRLGRTWESASGDGIYMSFVVPIGGNIGAITIAAGVYMCLALRKCGYDARLKWPNDILIDGKKVCGILSEGIFNDDGNHYVVVGAGLNLSRCFDGVLAETAISLKDAKKEAEQDVEKSGNVTAESETLTASKKDHEFGVVSRDDLLWGMHLMIGSVGRAVRTYDGADLVALIDMAKKYSATIGREVEVHNVHDRAGYAAIARDIDIDGALVVETESGERRKIFAGEVTLKKRWDEERQNGKMGFKLGKRLK